MKEVVEQYSPSKRLRTLLTLAPQTGQQPLLTHPVP